jgi:hypothetical protein
VISFTPRTLYPQGKSPWYPLDRRLGGPQSRSGRGGEDKNSQPLPGNEPLNILIYQYVFTLKFGLEIIQVSAESSNPYFQTLIKMTIVWINFRATQLPI